MNKQLGLLKQFGLPQQAQKLPRALLLSHWILGLGLWIAIAPVALAQYTPPSGVSRPQSPTITTGRRGGCTGSSRTMLTVLAPQTHVGRTTSTHPTLSWFVPDQDTFPIELQLLRRLPDNGTTGAKWQVVKQVMLPSTPGMMSWSLSAEEPGLEAGQRYRWQVALVCDLNHPSGALREAAEFDVVEPSPEVLSTFDQTNDDLALANLYARTGFWYDAFQQTLTASDPQLKRLRLSFLQDLVQIEVDRQSSSELGDRDRETSLKVQEKLTRILEVEQ